jgi:riboflavin synthase
MFTGIIKEIGTVIRTRRGNPWSFSINAPETASTAKRGDSICVSGACLTIVKCAGGTFDVDVSEETVRRTIFSGMRSGVKVNLEPALTLQKPLDGHIVQGHVDATGTIRQVTGNKQKLFRIRCKTDPGPLIVEKGSIAINGISLTIANVYPGNEFSVSVIPVTLEATDLKFRSSGDAVNIEYDIIGKYAGAWLKRGWYKQ